MTEQLKPMTPFRAAALLRRFKHDEQMLGPNEQAALDFAISAITALTTSQPAQAGEVDERVAPRWTVSVEPVAVSGEPDAHFLRASIGNQAFHIGPDYMETKQEAEFFAEMFLHAIEVGHRASLPTQPAAQATRTTADTLREIKAASCKDCGASGYTDPGEPDSPDGPGRPAVVCGACMGTGWRNGAHISDQQATPEPDEEDQWRDVALRFDKHRMQALWHLNAMLKDPVKHADSVRQFLKDPTHPAAATPEPVGEVVYQLQSGDGKWIDQTRASYDYNVKHGNSVRVLHTHPAPGVPEWVVNDLGELGVKVGDRFFFLYKGDNIEYGECGDKVSDSGIALHDDGTPMRYRTVGKVEFGETCWPVHWVRRGYRDDRYVLELVYEAGLSDGTPQDAEWRFLPAAAKAKGADHA